MWYEIPDPTPAAIFKVRAALERAEATLAPVLAELGEVQDRVAELQAEVDFARGVLDRLEDARPQ